LHIEWQIADRDIQRVKAFIREQRNNALLRKRRLKNLASTKPAVRKEQFWQAMASMRLTSVQRSGPKSHVAKFITRKPFLLGYPRLLKQEKVETFIRTTLKGAGGIRFSTIIAHHLAYNFDLLEKGEWRRTLAQCNRLLGPAPRAVEKEIAAHIHETFKGFGPKQSRNLLQTLGLTRYEIPIDSRVTKWLNEFGFPIHLSATALADPSYYEFVSDGFQVLCARSNVYPCILDAAIFAYMDGQDAWSEDSIY
jgi:hypothetical protein